jgi:hypothetical protein
MEWLKANLDASLHEYLHPGGCELPFVSMWEIWIGKCDVHYQLKRSAVGNI